MHLKKLSLPGMQVACPRRYTAQTYHSFATAGRWKGGGKQKARGDDFSLHNTLVVK